MRNSSSLDWLRFMHTPNDYRVSQNKRVQKVSLKRLYPCYRCCVVVGVRFLAKNFLYIFRFLSVFFLFIHFVLDEESGNQAGTSKKQNTGAINDADYLSRIPTEVTGSKIIGYGRCTNKKANQ